MEAVDWRAKLDAVLTPQPTDWRAKLDSAIDLAGEKLVGPREIRSYAREVFAKEESSDYARMRAARAMARLPELEADNPRMAASRAISEVVRSTSLTRETWMMALGLKAKRSADKIASGDRSFKNYVDVAAYLEEDKKLSELYGRMSSTQKFAEFLGGSLQFASGMAAGGPIAGLIRGAITKGAKKGAAGLARKAAGEVIAESARMAISPQLGKMVAEKTVARMAPKGTDVEGVTLGEPFIKALPKAAGEQLIQQLTERTGQVLTKVPGFNLLARRLPAPIRQATELSGPIGESLEERVEDVSLGIYRGLLGEGWHFGPIQEIASGDPERVERGLESLVIEGVVIGALTGPGSVADMTRRRARAQQLKPLADKWARGGSATEAITGQPAVLKESIPVEDVYAWALQEEHANAVDELLKSDSPTRDQWRRAGLPPAGAPIRQQFVTDLRMFKEIYDAEAVLGDQGVPKTQGDDGQGSEEDRSGDVREPGEEQVREEQAGEVAPAPEVPVTEPPPDIDKAFDETMEPVEPPLGPVEPVVKAPEPIAPPAAPPSVEKPTEAAPEVGPPIVPEGLDPIWYRRGQNAVGTRIRNPNAAGLKPGTLPWRSWLAGYDSVKSAKKPKPEAKPKPPAVEPPPVVPKRPVLKPEAAVPSLVDDLSPEAVTERWLASKGDERGFYERRQTLVDNVRRLVNRMGAGTWSTLDKLTVKNRSGRKDTRQTSDNLKELRELGVVQVAWDSGDETDSGQARRRGSRTDGPRSLTSRRYSVQSRDIRRAARTEIQDSAIEPCECCTEVNSLSDGRAHFAASRCH